MPCKHDNHVHDWNTEGDLTIERCEKTCAFCGKGFQHAWFLRRHVSNVHCKQYPNLKVEGGWTGSPNGNRRPGSPEKRKARKAHNRKQSNMSVSSNASSLTTGSTASDVVVGATNMPPMKPTTSEEAVPGQVFNSIEVADMPTFQDVFLPAMISPTGMDGMFARMLPEETTYMPAATATATEGLDIPERLFPDAAEPLFNGSFDIDEVFDFPVSFSSTSSVGAAWVTAQTARDSGVEIVREMPVVEHHPAAKKLTDGLNEVVTRLMAQQDLTEQEILYVLETFTDTYRIGMRIQMN